MKLLPLFTHDWSLFYMSIVIDKNYAYVMEKSTSISKYMPTHISTISMNKKNINIYIFLKSDIYYSNILLVLAWCSSDDYLF